jgi:hypothetical protein
MATSEAAENLPTAHSVQVLAPVSVPVLVVEPAAQVAHAAMFDATEYSLAAHVVQVVAAGAEPVSVMDPAGHGKQNDRPSEPW